MGSCESDCCSVSQRVDVSAGIRIDRDPETGIEGRGKRVFDFPQMFGQTIGRGARKRLDSSLDQRNAIKFSDQGCKALITLVCNRIGEPARCVNL